MPDASRGSSPAIDAIMSQRRMRRRTGAACDDKHELEDEHGGDIQDGPHDGGEGDEFPMGWPETSGQAPGVGGSAQSYAVSAGDGEQDE